MRGRQEGRRKKRNRGADRCWVRMADWDVRGIIRNRGVDRVQMRYRGSN